MPGITPADIEAAVRRVFGIPDGVTFPQQWGVDFNAHPPVGYREVIKGKTGDAITEKKVLRVDSTADEKYSILRHDLRDGAYEAIVSYFGPKAGDAHNERLDAIDGKAGQ